MTEALEQTENPKAGHKYFYLVTIAGLLFTVGLLAAAIIFREEIRNIGAYGYIGVFAVGVVGGIGIIPAPTLAMVFFLGGTLNPLFVGLTAAFGGAIGGITVYLTGAGVESMWSRFRAKGERFENQPGWRYDPVRPVQSKFWSRGERLYNKLAKWMEGNGGNWTLFITSAMIISPFYFAGLAAGSLRIGLSRFFLISWAGKTIRYLIVAYSGYLGLHIILKWIGG